MFVRAVCLAALFLATLVLTALPGQARAQAFTFDDVNPVLSPSPGTLWASQSIGSPAVTYDSIRDRFIMVFESRTPFSDARCPQGIWTLGLATSPDGTNWTMETTPLLQPSPGSGTYYSCVAAHPAAVFVPVGNGRMQVYFKAEEDTDGCLTSPYPTCPYTGIGRLRVTFDAAGDVSAVTIQADPVLALSGPGGFPSLVEEGGTYYMSYQSYPNVYVTASASLTSFGSGIVALDVDTNFDTGPTGDTAVDGPQWVYDEFFSPSLICDDSIAFPWALWVGSRDTNFGAVINGGWGKSISSTGASWSLANDPAETWANDNDWRHLNTLRLITGDYLVWFSKKDGSGNNAIYFGGTTLSFNNSDIQGQSCP